MKKYILIFFLFSSLAAYSGESSQHIIFLSKDSIALYPHYLNQGWKFMQGDDAARAFPDYDDSNWPETKPTLYLSDKSTPQFKGIGWFRLHFIADTTITGKPLALTMTHLGASEIYLDGTLLKSFGHIQGADSSVYFDPQEMPFIFTIPHPGEHVLAVRYANYHATNSYKTYEHAMAGFKMMIGESDHQIEMRDQRTTIISFILMLLCGIFFALGTIHFLMFLYYRSVKSNLYFSVFMFSLSTAFIIAFIGYTSHSASLELVSYYLLNPVFIISCLALAGFISELFGKNKLMFKIVVGFGIVTLILLFFGVKFYSQLLIALIIGVSFQALFTVIFAIVKRVKGARIIGAGILFFSLFIISIFFIGIAKGGYVNLDDSTTGGKIFIGILGLAVLSIPFSMSVYLAWSFSSINKNLAMQLDQVKVLSQQSLEHEQEKQRMLQSRKDELEKEVWDRTSELRDEKKKSDDLLLNILPAEVAEELKEKGRTNAKTYSMVTVMFTDFKDFTDVSEKISAELLVAEIDYCFSAFDTIIQKYRIEKIKTIGDAYICAAGLPVLNFTHAVDMTHAAIEIRDFISDRKKEKESRGEIPFDLRRVTAYSSSTKYISTSPLFFA